MLSQNVQTILCVDLLMVATIFRITNQLIINLIKFNIVQNIH
jgi:hypothetical protein